MIDEIRLPTTAEIEADGFITPPSALEYKGKATGFTADPMKECLYPKCEECDNYHGHYCTVPMVVSKQIFLLTEEKMAIMEKRLSDLENLVTDKILGL